MGNSTQRIDELLRRWSTSLFDISSNNELLNVNTDRKNYLKITSPTFSSLYEKFVLEERRFTFKQKVSQDNSFSVYQIISLINNLGYNLSVYRGDLDTNKNDNIEAIIKKILSTTRKFKEELGINILHISFGYIKWKPNNADECCNTPLINVPIEIKHDRINSPYELVKAGDPMVNKAFIYLTKKMGIELPPLDTSKGIDEYLTSLNQLIEDNGWEVSQTVSINCLKYQKIAMYEDLTRPDNIERIKKSKLLMTISGDWEYKDEEISPVNHDSVNETDRLLVLDADSSQMDALELASKGVSFVLYGPPGTGKSQTITNIIARSLGEGKKVLFVSQKQAALDVVYKKLINVRLDDFCLPLHDLKSNKREIIRSIAKPLGLERTVIASGAIERLRILEELKQKINKYKINVHEKNEELDISLYDVLEQYLNVLDSPKYEFEIPDINSITQDELRDLADRVKEYQIIYNRLNSVIFDVWKNTSISQPFTMQSKTDFENKLQNMINALSDFYEEIELIRSKISKPELTVKNYQEYHPYIERILSVSSKYPKLFTNNVNTIDDVLDALNVYIIGKDQLAIYETNLKEYYRESFLLGNLKEKGEQILNVLDEFINASDRFETEDYNSVMRDLDGYIEGVHLVQSSLSECKSSQGSLRGIFDLKNESLTVWENIIKVLSSNDFERSDLGSVFTYGVGYVTKLAELQKLQEKYEFHKGLVLVYCYESIFDIPLKTMKEYKKIIDDTTSFSRMFSKEYKKVKKELAPHFKKIDFGILDIFIASYQNYILILGEYQKEIDNFNSQYSKVEIDTNFDIMIKKLQICLDLKNLVKLKDIDLFISNVCLNKEDFLEDIKDYVKAVLKLKGNLDKARIDVDEFKDLANMNTTDAFKSISEKTDLIISVNSKLQKEINMLKPYLIDNSKIKELPITFNDMICYQSLREKLSNSKTILKYTFDIQDISIKECQDLIETVTTVKDYFNIMSKEIFDEAEVQNIIFQTDSKLKQSLQEADRKIVSSISSVQNLIDEFASYFNDKELIQNMEVKALIDYICEALSEIEGLNQYLNYQNYKKQLAQEIESNSTDALQTQRLVNFISCVEKNEYLENQNYANTFLRRYYEAFIDYIIFSTPYLKDTNRGKLINEIVDFSSICHEQFRISIEKIREVLLENVPRATSVVAYGDERKILENYHKQTRPRVSLRKIFDSIPNLMLRLKPCMMMSPLTVSSLLENNTYDFDVVIFDEASQVFPEDAVGAIYRGKQIIICGDDMQLPPTNFFTRTLNNDLDYNEDDDNQYDNEESILSLTQGHITSCHLKWHYRSKDERLIAFSNKHIYQSDLITFPTNFTKKEDYGVEFEKVEDGIYYSGAQGKNSGNPKEAERIVALIDRHIKKFPDRSLGIIAFGLKQQMCIEKAVDNYRRENPNHERFFAQDGREPFFIKNIESVQGDERDVIYFSIGFCKNEKGEFFHNFGPIQINGGERRLNVAISRAKMNLKVVSSIEYLDIIEDRINSEGAKLLRKYLYFAQTGLITTSENQRLNAIEHSSFQESVASFLEKNGYSVYKDYGCSKYKIDIAVVDKNDNNNLICAIELDGKYYREDEVCRSREYLKPQILNQNGWKVYRMWSYCWVVNNSEEKRDLLRFLKGEISDPEVNDSPDIGELSVPVIEDNNTLEFTDYVSYTFPKSDKSITNINVKLIEGIVRIEEPIHLERVIEQCASHYGQQKNITRNRILSLLNRCGFTNKDKFLYFDESKCKNVRINTSENKRELAHVHPEEMKTCILKILSISLGLDIESLARSVMGIFGHHVYHQSIKDFLENRINELIKQGLIISEEGTLRVNGEDNE